MKDLTVAAHPAPRPMFGRAAMRGLARGLLGGVVATAAMSAFMLTAQKAGLLGRMPPRKISDRFLHALGVRAKTPEPARRAFAALTHVAFGGACGALFGMASEINRARVSTAPRERSAPIGAGLAYGTAIWAVSYAGWVPALGIMPMPQHDRPGRPTSMLLAHWIFGAALAKLGG